ncbi:GDYXXLXY domain-containing protein [Rhodoligotrophos defluvii]|uniref:GDYXXLXY domain-containing protein n=1 Tax=Rhodoligotrophos defluvii TaxID=2561934 RepID=UPI001485C21D|nr:GDYXXLXY domain-containing protein [Rhodoligotrophos defluvii]
MSKRFMLLGFGLAFLLQGCLLFGMIAGRAMLMANGTEVRLAVVPVDPRDFLRGDYVILSYDISRLKTAQLGGDRDFTVGDPIYVALAPDGQTWHATAIYHTYPKDVAGPVLRGRITSASQTPNCTGPSCWEYGVDYGLEKFFVPEGAGRALEELRNDQRLTADVAVGKDGASVIKRLRVDGQVRYEAGLF